MPAVLVADRAHGADKRGDGMRTKDCWSHALLFLAVVLVLLVLVWLSEAPELDIDPGLAREYKSFRVGGH